MGTIYFNKKIISQAKWICNLKNIISKYFCKIKKRFILTSFLSFLFKKTNIWYVFMQNIALICVFYILPLMVLPELYFLSPKWKQTNASPTQTHVAPIKPKIHQMLKFIKKYSAGTNVQKQAGMMVNRIIFTGRE